MFQYNRYKAAGVLLFNEKGQIYLGLDRKGFVCDFGGKKEDDDENNSIETAIRECREECGITPTLSVDDAIYLPRSKYHLYLSFTKDCPKPTNEIKEIHTYLSLDNIASLHPRLDDVHCKKYVRSWISKYLFS